MLHIYLIRGDITAYVGCSKVIIETTAARRQKKINEEIYDKFYSKKCGDTPKHNLKII